MCVQSGKIPDDGVGSCMLKGTVSDCCKCQVVCTLYVI